MKYAYKRERVDNKNMWIRKWYREDSYACIRYDFISYDTCIGIFDPESKTLYIGSMACYTPTTRRHSGIMARIVNELIGTPWEYDDVKSACKLNDYIVSTATDGIICNEGLANEMKHDMNVCFELNKDYRNEMALQ